MIERYELVLMADHHQILVADVDHVTDPGTLWTEGAVAVTYAIGRDLVAIGTARDAETSVWLEIHSERPPVELEGWDQIIECSIATPRRRIMALGCSDYGPDAFTVDVPTDRTSVRISWGGLDRVSEGALEGDDRYVVQVWPSEPHDTIRLK